MDKCPGLIGGLNDPSTSCNIPSAIDEQIDGVLSKLPGDNPLGQWGVGPSSDPAPSSAASSSLSTAVHILSTPSASSHATTAAPTTTGASVSDVPTATSSNQVTLVTSYVSKTSVIWTTITLPAPTGTSTSAPAGWSYKGCYSDNLNARALTGITFADIGNHEVTNTKCTAYCGAKGYSLAGTEYGGQCFCDNELAGSSSLADSKCDMPCEGDSSETCGGSLALSVYTKSAAARRQPQRIRGSSQ